MRVLIAGDHHSAAAVIKETLLRSEGDCRDVTVVSLSELVDRVAQHRPEVVLLSIADVLEQAIPLIREIRETLPTRVLVIGPAADAKLILRILREGAFQYVDQSELQVELKSAFDRLRLEPPLRIGRGRVIAVVGAGGGSGASTLAVNLAAIIGQQHGKCALLDLNLEGGDLSTLLDLQPSHSLADFCRNVQRMDSRMFEQCLAGHPSGVFLLSSPPSHKDRADMTPRGVRKALSMARNNFPYVLADVDRRIRTEHHQVFYQSDIILLVMRLDMMSLRHASRLLDYLDDLQISRERVRVVASQYGRPKELRAADVGKALGLSVEHYVPQDARAVNRANNQGVPVVLQNPSARISKSVYSLAASVNGCGRGAAGDSVRASGTGELGV